MRNGLWALIACFLIIACTAPIPVLPGESPAQPLVPLATTAALPTLSPEPTKPQDSTPGFPIAPAHPTLANWPGFVSTDPIRLAWFYKQPADGDLEYIAQNHDFFIMTRRDEVDRDHMKQLGATAPFFQYLLLMEIHNPDDCDRRPFSNNVAYETGDYCWIAEEHPDWFLRDSDGEIVTKDQTVYMDPASAGFRQFWIERARRAQEELGWDGIYIDNVYASLYKFEDRSITLEKYPHDESLRAAVEDFLHLIRNSYAKPAGKPVFANILPHEEADTWLRYMRWLDGAFVEAFAVDWDEDYIDPEDWEEQLIRLRQVQREGKFLVLVSQSDDIDDSERQTFALASYLLINEGTAFFRYGHHSEYTTARLYDNYALDLGQPLGPAEKTGSSWRREFTNGSVTVDPDKQEAEIQLN